MSGLMRRVVLVLLAATVSGCFLWRSEHRPPVVRRDFPPPLDAVIDGPLIWAEAHPNWGSAPLTVYFNVELLEDATIEVWAWDFGDGAEVARRRLAQHIYEHAGTFEARVWGRDKSGRISMDVVTVRVT
jgi:hypothetical protein